MCVFGSTPYDVVNIELPDLKVPLNTLALPRDVILGWRKWRLHWDHNFDTEMLYSPIQYHLWDPIFPATTRPAKTGQRRGQPTLPGRSDGGIYAYPNLSDLNNRRPWFDVYGIVALWGRVYVHHPNGRSSKYPSQSEWRRRQWQTGYRAQYAYPVALFNVHGDAFNGESPKRQADRLRRRYPGIHISTSQAPDTGRFHNLVAYHTPEVLQAVAA